jgi:hypothetical protein
MLRTLPLLEVFSRIETILTYLAEKRICHQVASLSNQCDISTKRKSKPYQDLSLSREDEFDNGPSFR